MKKILIQVYLRLTILIQVYLNLTDTYSSVSQLINKEKLPI